MHRLPMETDLELYGLRKEGNDLLLTDVILPGTSGVQMAQRLAAAHPRMRVLYVSGYTTDAIVHHGGHDSNLAFLSKPFSLPALARKIRSILDADQTQPLRAPPIVNAKK